LFVSYDDNPSALSAAIAASRLADGPPYPLATKTSATGPLFSQLLTWMLRCWAEA
jgi:hypothetical protein